MTTSGPAVDEPIRPPTGGTEDLVSSTRYRRMLLNIRVATGLVAVIPLLILTGINYQQYREAFSHDLTRPIAQMTSNAKNTSEFFFSERLAALFLVIREKSREELADSGELRHLLTNMKQAFGGFVDLGLISAEGKQVSYAGPYNLLGKTYSDQDWFHEVSLRDRCISEVFMGHRQFPHFVMAVRYELPDHQAYVLRATIDTEMINRQILGLHGQPNSDIFLVNRAGILQTPSRFHGNALEHYPLPVPSHSPQAVVEQTRDADGRLLIIGSALVEGSPFIIMLVNRPDMPENWLSLRRNLALFTIGSILLIIVVITWGPRRMVGRIQQADMRRAALFHNLEYTNKMAAIGRLGAGVAHEINNPLAIIEERAGLMKDLLTFAQESPESGKLIEQVDSILNSVERCSKITHRLLGFAKHMDLHADQINLKLLFEEVLGFLGKEAEHRNIQVMFDIPDDLPTIATDRGQLQQVFLNVVNNAFAAMSDGGRLEVKMERRAGDRVAVQITDNGKGIPKEHLEHVFEPFFTTKKGSGTGLGLSITYGIVQKLGGETSVQSTVGKGTCFTILLPVQRD